MGANHGLHQTTEPTPLLRHFLKSTVVIAVAALLAGCGNSDSKAGGGRGAGGSADYSRLCHPARRRVEQELPGRSPRSRCPSPAAVSGVIQRRLFREGSIVQRARPPTRSIRASISRNGTGVGQCPSARPPQAAQTRAARYKPLAEMEAVSSRIIPTRWGRSAQASVAQNNAALPAPDQRSATPRPAPITGASACRR